MTSDMDMPRSRTSKGEFSGWTQSFRNSGFFEDYSPYKSRNTSSEIIFSSKLHSNLWKTFSTELFCRRSWWFHVGFSDLHSVRKPRPQSSFARPAMPFVNQESLVLKFPIVASWTAPNTHAHKWYNKYINGMYQLHPRVIGSWLHHYV